MIHLSRLKVLLTALVISLCASASASEVVVVVVSAKSQVMALNPNQISDIFLGKTNTFPNGGQAVPIDLTEGTPARDEFYAKLTGKSAAQIKAHWSKIIFTGRGLPPKEVLNGNSVKIRLAENPNAISYIDQSLVDGSVRILYTPENPNRLRGY